MFRRNKLFPFTDAMKRQLSLVTAPTVVPSPLRHDILEYMITRKGNSPLVCDFLRWCVHDAKILFHYPVRVGLRQNGMRGIFLDQGFPVSIPRNKVVFTVPLEHNFITPEAISHQKFAAQSLTFKEFEEKVKGKDARSHHDLIPDKEMLYLIPHFYLGMQVAGMAEQMIRWNETEKMTSMEDSAFEARELSERKKGEGLMPYIRMLDDENFSDDYIWEMFQHGLDNFQSTHYHEMLSMFSHAITNIHAGLELPFPRENYKRLTRVILARTELMRSIQDLQTSPWKRKIKKTFQKLFVPRNLENKDLQMGLLPMIDMLNHSNRPNVKTKIVHLTPEQQEMANGSKFGVAVLTLNEVHPGHEICRHYNFSMERGVALFRYGFLPYDLFLVDKLDPWKEHYCKGYGPNVGEETDVAKDRRQNVDEEVKKLQNVFKKNRN